MHMTHATQTKVLLTAAFFFGAAAGLMAQSEVKSAEPTEVNLIALNTTTASYPPAAAPFVPNSQAQSTPSSSISPETTAPAQPTVKSTTGSYVKQAPGIPALATQSSSNHAGSGNSWFSAGPQAFPNTARMDPTFLLPLSQYGAAPTAVKFSFGKK
jgi:hypothetical protein